MTEVHGMIEHFFRHEYGRLVAVLTRSLGVRHLELAEDVVQAAMSKALQSWSARGIPDDPAGWLYRTARNLAIDHLRREGKFQRHAIKIAATSLPNETEPVDLDSGLCDDVLRMFFLCCHNSIPVPSQIALALKIVVGFSVTEIASALLTTVANVEKRISRAKERLREMELEISEMTPAEMTTRLEAVLLVVYLLFNNGFAATLGTSPICRDLCDEAIRIARMLVAHRNCDTPDSRALLALLLMHSARFDARVDHNQCIVLLAAQERSAWNWPQIREAMQWMLASASGDRLSRYHIEAAIAWEHCRSESVADTDWSQVTHLYSLLTAVAPSAMVRLNLDIATSYSHGLDLGLSRLLSISDVDRRMLRPWWDCAVADLYYRQKKTELARSHWNDALLLASSHAQRELISRKLSKSSD